MSLGHKAVSVQGWTIKLCSYSCPPLNTVCSMTYAHDQRPWTTGIEAKDCAATKHEK